MAYTKGTRFIASFILDNPLSISLHMRATHTGRRQPGRQPLVSVCCKRLQSKGGSGEDDAHDAAHDNGAGRGQPAGAGDAPAPAARRRHLHPVRRRLPAGTRVGIRWPADRQQPRVPASGMVAADPRSPASPPGRERALQRGHGRGGERGGWAGQGHDARRQGQQGTESRLCACGSLMVAAPVLRGAMLAAGLALLAPPPTHPHPIC